MGKQRAYSNSPAGRSGDVDDTLGGRREVYNTMKGGHSKLQIQVRSASMERSNSKRGIGDEADSPLRIDSNQPGPGVMHANLLLIKETLSGGEGRDYGHIMGQAISAMSGV
jgi:hypothetical protein